MNARVGAANRLDALAEWITLNQRWLVGELARLRQLIEARLGNAGSWPDQPAALRESAAFVTSDGTLSSTTAPRGDSVARPMAWNGDAAMPPALERLACLFALTRFERDLLLLLAGIELDRGLRKLLTHGVTFADAMAWLPDAHWDALSPQSALRHWMLLEPASLSNPAHSPLVLDERVLHALTGVGALDERLRGIASMATAAPHADEASVEKIASALEQAAAGAPPVIALEARSAQPDDDVLRRDGAVAAAARCGLQVLVVSIDDLPVDAVESEALARRLDREAALSQAALVLWRDSAAELGAEAQRRALVLIERLRSTVLLAAAVPGAALRARLTRPLRVLTLPTPAAARDATASASQRRALQQFHVPPALLRAALAEAAEASVSAESGAAGVSDANDTALWSALRRASRGGLGELAERIESQTCFEDLVLPSATLAQLREIAAQLAHRHTVYEDWGFARRARRGLGIAALFAGDSGTGKTMAAEAVANHLELDLYRIDLASTVSKYIGETEKNLKRLFDAAEASGAVLLFDEADALFGKRSEVKDSHDRYANIEVAYLLQRIESYRGLAILTTNLKNALDKSFLRRLRFIVQFPFPDEAARETLWRAQVPPDAPCAVRDWRALARAQLAGGNIRAAALNAAFAAAARAVPIDDALLAQAVHAEFAKLDRAWAPGAGA